MKTTRLTIGLLSALGVCIALVVAIEAYWTESVPHPNALAMRAAVDQTASWFDQIADLKKARGIPAQAAAHTPHGQMIGDDYTFLTTTLGSLKAKSTAANPEFGAVITRLLVEAGIDSSSVVGVTLSASFPSLAVASLAALQTLGCRTVMISSLGASTYGANQVNATWLDMENWLRQKGSLLYSSEVVTYGAEGDRGGGLTEEGLAAMDTAALRNGYEIWVPATLDESIQSKVDLLKDSGIDLLINIGGNQASLGGCAHGPTIPNGYRDNYLGCTHPDRGIISRLAQQSVPYIHLLNIRDLAIRYRLDLEAGGHPNVSDDLYLTKRVNSAPIVAGLVMIGLLLGLTRRYAREPDMIDVKERM